MSIPPAKYPSVHRIQPVPHPSHQVPSICTLILTLGWPPEEALQVCKLPGQGSVHSPRTCTLRQPQTPPKTATPHPLLLAHRPGSPPLPPRQVCGLTFPPTPQPSSPGVRDRVQPGSDIEQELHSLKSTLPVNKQEGKKNHIRAHLTVKKITDKLPQCPFSFISSSGCPPVTLPDLGDGFLTAPTAHVQNDFFHLDKASFPFLWGS